MKLEDNDELLYFVHSSESLSDSAPSSWPPASLSCSLRARALIMLWLFFLFCCHCSVPCSRDSTLPESFSLSNREGPWLISPIPPQPRVHLKQLGATSLLLARSWGPICFGSLWKAAVTKAIWDGQSLIALQVAWHEWHPYPHAFQLS